MLSGPYRGGRGVGLGDGQVVSLEAGRQALPVGKLRCRHCGNGDNVVQDNAAGAVVTVASPTTRATIDSR
jgi:hypothetical protein